MEEITNAVINGLIQIALLLIGLSFSGITEWLKAKRNESINRGQKEEVILIEKLVSSAVDYAQQKFKEYNGSEKFAIALDKIQEELFERGIVLTDHQVEMFIESAVKTMNDNNALKENNVLIETNNIDKVIETSQDECENHEEISY